MQRVGLGAQLYTAFTDYVGAQIAHMSGEEAHLNPLFWEHFTDDELEGMRGQVMGKMTPERRGQWFRWMLPSLSQVQLVGMLSGMRATMPPPAFEGLRGAVGPILGERWTSIDTELGI